METNRQTDLLITDPLPERGVRGYVAWAVVLAVLAATSLALDLAATRALQVEQLPGDARRILKLSEFFGHGYIVLVCTAGIWMLAPDKRRFLPRVMACALLPGIYIQGVKMLVSRDRPIELRGAIPDNIFATWHGVMPGGEFNSEYATQAFMSAHTATAIGLAIGLMWLFPRGRWLFLTLAILAGLQRIAFEAHWLSDVLAGAALAVMTAGAMTQNWGLGYVCGLIERPAYQRQQSRLAHLQETSGEDRRFGDNDSRIAA